MAEKQMFGKVVNEVVEYVLTGLVVLFLGEGFGTGSSSTGGDSKQAAPKQRRRGIFESSFDETTMMTLSTVLSDEAKTGLDLLMTELLEPKSSDLVAQFREKVAGMPTPVERQEKYQIKDDKGKDITKFQTVRTEYTKEDARVVYLEQICGGIRNKAEAKAMKDRLLAVGFIKLNTPGGWVKKNICQLFGVNSLDEITEDRAARGIGKLAIAMPQKKNHHRSFLPWLFEREAKKGPTGRIALRTRFKRKFAALIVFAFVAALAAAIAQ